MTGISFRIAEASPVRSAMMPTLAFRIDVEDRSGRRIHGVVLSAQIRIEANLRDYSTEEADRLRELFGEPERWSSTLRPFLWAHATTTAGAFRTSTRLELPVTCSYDLEVAAAKYFHALDGGDIPLLFLFTGTVFGEGPGGGLSVSRIAWDEEARFRLPTATWRALMDAHWPDSGWLRLERDTLNALMRFKARRAVPTWDSAMKALLAAAGEDDR
jgi:Family of unknown function (DUF6084)